MYLFMMKISMPPAICQVCTKFQGYRGNGDLESPDGLRDGTGMGCSGAEAARWMLVKIRWLLSRAGAK